MVDEDDAATLPVGRRDAEAKNVADFGEGGCARAALAGGDGLDGSPDEADDAAAVRPGRLSYLFMHVGIKLTRLETATHHQQKLKKQTISAARSLANSYVQPYVQL
jgi:hypothetical protein